MLFLKIKRVVFIVINLFFVVACLYVLFFVGFRVSALLGLLLFGFGAYISIFEKQWDKWQSNLQQKRIKKTLCTIENNHFYFPKGYYFKHGYLKYKKELPFEIINEIRLNTFPITALINHNEIIFLCGLTQTDFDNWPHATCPLTNPTDNWSLICEEYLDTEYSSEEKQATNETLIKNGFSNDELIEIKNKISSKMNRLTFHTWEWEYYGQYDVLKQFLVLSETTYWWSMDIALKTKNNTY